jgi:HEPN domain-containing protein
MNNLERKDYLIKQGEDTFELIEKYWGEKNWNMVIRRAQETAECYIKGFLKLINIEFPKEHDLGGYLEEILIKRGLPFKKERIGKIKEISEELTEKRAPAFYGEVFYSKEEARRARKGAKEVKEFIETLLESLGEG